MILSAFAWAATVAILASYAYTVRWPEKALPFHISNALGSIPLAWLNMLAHTWPAVVVNLGFGVPAWVAVVREISRRRKDKRFRQAIHHGHFPDGT